MLVAVVFPKVSVIIAGVASVSGLLVAVSREVAVLGPIELFCINTVLSLSLLFFFSLPLACFESHSFVVVPVPCLLSLSIACLCCLFVSQACSVICLFVIIGLHRIIIGFVVVVRFCFTCDVLVCTKVGLQSICC